MRIPPYRKRKLITLKRVLIMTIIMIAGMTWYNACDSVNTNSKTEEVKDGK